MKATRIHGGNLNKQEGKENYAKEKTIDGALRCEYVQSIDVSHISSIRWIDQKSIGIAISLVVIQF